MIYIVRCVVELTTPLHCGGGEGDGLLDSPVVRDAFGLWRIQGSSLAGIFREFTECHLGKQTAEMLFGSAKDSDTSSRIWCSDAVLLDFDGSFAWQHFIQGQKSQITTPSFVRDHVKIDLESGTASDSGKFDMEYVPAGTRFAFEISLDGWLEDLKEEWVQWFGYITTAIKQGKLQFGGKNSSGYGHYTAIQCQGRHFDLKQEKSMNEWLNLQDAPDFETNCAELWEPEISNIAQDNNEKLSGYIEIPLKNKSPILIGGGVGVEADICFATTAYCNQQIQQYEQKYILPSTSLKGVLRHRVFYILQSLDIDNAQNHLDNLFGFINGNENATSKISVHDAILSFTDKNEPAKSIVQHVTIDRFTCGALDGHLFNEEPLWQDDICTSLYIEVKNISILEAALLFHAILDMAQGRIAVGSGINRGNGRFIQNTSEPLRFEFNWKGQTLSHTDQEHLEAWLDEADFELYAAQGD